MTPRQAQLALLSFAIVAAGVTFNALVLQRRPSAAAEAMDTVPARAPADRGRTRLERLPGGTGDPHVSELSSEEPTLRITRFAPDSAKLDALSAAREDETDTATISAIQRELKQRSYGPLPVDGLLRLPTRAAIMAFQYDRGLPLTGEASAELLKQILLGTATSGEVSGAGKVRSIHAEEIVRTVQKSLAALDYPCSIDGRLGQDTVKAIRDFEMDRGLVPKGRVSAEVLARLGEAAASAKR